MCRASVQSKGRVHFQGGTGLTTTHILSQGKERVCLLHPHNDQFRSLNQDTGFWGLFQFCSLISRPNCTDLPCFFNGPIVMAGQ